ncbi:MAG TPA: phosphoglycerate kinase [Myxococcota bacterium]|jgi:phosphoglycerate kinase|nr:phosphoglycerate kinase [Myxococcota bacterium]
MDPRKDIPRMEDLPLEGRRVLMRVDLDCPLGPDHRILDETKLHAAMPAIRKAVDAGAKLVLAAHLGAPAGRRLPDLSMAVVGERLAALLGQDVFLPEDAVGDGPRKVVMERVEGEVVLLENLGFYAEEEAGDDVFAQRLAMLADVYVNEAFGLSHRRLASLSALPRYLPQHGIGPAFQKELGFLGRARAGAETPLVLMAGGDRVDESIGVVQAQLGRVRTLAVGGPVAASWLAAKGVRVGLSPTEPERLEALAGLVNRAKLRGVDLVLPTDVVVARGVAGDGPRETVPVDAIPDDARIVDLGPASIDAFRASFGGARLVLWTGVLGQWGENPCLGATEAVAKALSRCSATAVIAGPAIAAAIGRLMLTPFLAHVSTGGEAALKYLEGETMPAMQALAEEN